MTQYIRIDLRELVTYDSVYEYLCKQFEVELPYSQNFDALYDKITEKIQGDTIIHIYIYPKSYLISDNQKINKTLNFLNKITQINQHFYISTREH